MNSQTLIPRLQTQNHKLFGEEGGTGKGKTNLARLL